MRTIAAVILIVLGLAGLTVGGISFTREKKVVDLGPVEVSREKRETLPLSPIVGGVLLVSGLGLLVYRPRGN